MKLLKRIALAAVLGISAASMSAQVGIKTNLVGWGTTNANLGLEFGTSRHSTLQLMGYLNPWDFKGDKYFHAWMAQPEYRYYFCEKFNGHFIGIHAVGGQYNAKRLNFPLKDFIVSGDVYDQNNEFPSVDHNGKWPDLRGANAGRHVEGWYVGAGFTYGYQWMLSKHWNFEASIGVGYVYSPLKYYGRCQQVIDKRKLHYVGPTNAQLSFMYIF